MQELEIEFKNLLTKSEYIKLYEDFEMDEPVKQINHYFDTPLFHLKDAHSALRIREKSGKLTLTLKQPVEDGVLETHQPVTKIDLEDMLSGGGLIGGEISDLLELLNIPPQDIVHFGSLETNRTEKNYKDGLLVLDHSVYLGHEDYELEYEVASHDEGKENFLSLLTSYKIPVRETDNKIKRFYKARFMQNPEGGKV
ncbi:CYTH domain-containing protein [Jeotgalibacillus haloalkalitolerans]|uniref:CYTH domain-containing protein n=1 Tax=Jeotgalibacillus haloalkalitolerans TaxID=3104292 RepID=A0ABU5KPB8_9BACL|nr:CYTH domain-containing protein [Jeotgalibacillus sp. HH7-29]MDZ5712997.1 CYTH domain-containing protein [Jeotgalibacillus sp. HH7-29]